MKIKVFKAIWYCGCSREYLKEKQIPQFCPCEIEKEENEKPFEGWSCKLSRVVEYEAERHVVDGKITYPECHVNEFTN